MPLEPGSRKMRTTLLAESLVKRQHNVLWWTSAFDHFKKKWDFSSDAELVISNGIKIKALKGIGYKRNISLRRFVDHRILAKKFKKLASKENKPDVIVTSMPPHDLAFEVVAFANKNNIPVLVDIRDEWPDLLIQHVPVKLQKIAKMVLFKEFVLTKKTMKGADALVAMMDPFLDWGLKYAERDKTWAEKVFYLGYKRNVGRENKSNKIVKLKDRLENKFVVTFIGTFVHSNNPSILLDCAKKLIDKDICFVLAGCGDLFDKIKKESSDLPNVILPGWLEQSEINTLLEHSNVGVCPATQIRDAFPNKVFVYLSAGLPILSAWQGDLQKTIDKYRIGFYYTPNDAEALIGNIKKLYENNELYTLLSNNALRVFDELFDADKIYYDYASHIESVAQAL